MVVKRKTRGYNLIIKSKVDRNVMKSTALEIVFLNFEKEIHINILKL